MIRFVCICKEPEETRELGRVLGALARNGDCLALHGQLGAGKTVFSQGFALGLGIDEPITSPTYTLINEYEGSVPFFHLDLYRISDEEEASMLGLEELFPRGVMLVEWAERAPGILPQDHGSITISIEADKQSRRVECYLPEHLTPPPRKEDHTP